MEKANFILLEDKISIYQTTDIASEEIAQLNSGDEIIRDEKLIKNKITWYTVVLSDDRKGFIQASSKGIEVSLVVLNQSSADVFETPCTSAKVILTYKQGDKFQVISGEKQEDQMWIKTESLSGVIGFMQASTKVKDVTPLPPSQKWPYRMGYVGALAGVAIEFDLHFSYHYNFFGLSRAIIPVVFLGGYIIAYLFTKFFIRVIRS